MLAVYVAGPYRSATGWGIEQNVRRAEVVGLDIARLGILPVVPHTMFRWYHGTEDDQFWLEATLELMRRCDAVFFIDGWAGSEGCRGERLEAVDRGMLQFFEDDGGSVLLSQWAKR